MKRLLRMWSIMLRVSLQRMIEYRADFLLWSLVSLFWTVFSLLFYNILFLQTPSIAGWSKEQTYLLVGVYMIIDSATWSLFWRGIESYVESIFEGTLDFALVQPLDTQLLLSMKHPSFTQIPRMFIGVFIVVQYLPQVNILQILASFCLILLTLFTIYLLWFFTATMNFWAEKMRNVIEIVPSLRRIWNFPSDIYSGPLSALLTIIVPLGLISTTPTRFLLGDYRWSEVLILLIFTTVLFVITRWFFLFSIKRYSSAGS